jgi:hypothetical protein
MIPGSPMLWLLAISLAAVPVTYGVTKLNAQREVKAAYEQGKQAGLGAASATTVASATKTAEAERAAEDATPLLTDRAEAIALCKRSASCRERGTLK